MLSSRVVPADSPASAESAFKWQFPDLQIVGIALAGARNDPDVCRRLGVQPTENRWVPFYYIVTFVEPEAE